MTDNDSLNQLAVNFIAHRRLVGGEPRVIKKLPRHAREGKTAVCIFRLWIARAKNSFVSRRIHLVFPHQFVRKGETVAREFKMPRNGLA